MLHGFLNLHAGVEPVDEALRLMADTVAAAAAGTDPRGVLHPAITAKLHLLDGIGSWEELADPEKAARMQEFDSWPGAAAAPEVDVRADSSPGPHGPVPVRIYTPPVRGRTAPRWSGCTAARSSAGDLDMREADGVAREICARAGAVVVSVDYRLCHGGVTYPVPHDDVVAAVRWVRDNAAALGVDADRISVGGASAGANLAAGATLRLRDDDAWQPASLVLAYPVAHPSLPPASASLTALWPTCRRCSASSRRTPRSSTATTWAARTAGPTATPCRAWPCSTGSAPSWCSTPSSTTCGPPARRSPRQLAAASVDVRHVLVRGLPHGFLNQPAAALEPVDEALASCDGRRRRPSGSRVTPNPLLPGFNPDPSIVRADDAYYLVTSTFEYLPGIPVYRSTDLVEWTQIGNVATRAEQVQIGEVPTGLGVWAPTIRYREGTFYVIVTIALSPKGCVVYTATDPAGPWDDGTTIDGIDGIDPDLAWDDDGTAYVTFSGLALSGADLGSTWASSRCASTSPPARRSRSRAPCGRARG